jgi:4-diphosphocytidyl-2-C-methyl-D-erythritol kinase
MRRTHVPAKLNLALVVGPVRSDGLHAIATVMQKIDICDRLELEKAEELAVDGFPADTLVRRALGELAEAAGDVGRWRVRLEKKIPIAAGLGGGSADAAAALVLANATLPEPIDRGRLHELAFRLGADVPFFLEPGPKLAEGAGERLVPLDLPQDYWLVVALPERVSKPSTGEVYRRYDALRGAEGFDRRRERLLDALERCRRPRDLAALPRNDLAEAAGAARELLGELRGSGALRADLSGAGPAVYGVFVHRRDALAAARRCRRLARVWVTVPVW